MQEVEGAVIRILVQALAKPARLLERFGTDEDRLASAYNGVICHASKYALFRDYFSQVSDAHRSVAAELLINSEPVKKSGENIPKNRCRTTIPERMGGNASGTALYRESGRLFRPRGTILST